MSSNSKKGSGESYKQVIPDSTTKEKDIGSKDSMCFNEGQDVLVMHKDGRFYLGTIVEICSESEKCLVKFGDGTERWSCFKDITPLSVPEADAVMCVVCKSSETDSENNIIVCDVCARGYHQKCHQPAIILGEEDWSCCRCQCNENCQLSTIIQKTVSSTSKDCSLPQTCDELPYELNELVWDIDHTMNTSQQYCYCGKTGDWFVKMIQCGRCLQWFHEKCVHCLLYPLHLGDRFYVFVCSICNFGVEFVRRLEMKWIDMVHLVIFNLVACHAKRYYDLDSEILSYVNSYWNTLQLPPTIYNTTVEGRRKNVMNVLSKNKYRFRRCCRFRKRDTWGLRKRGPPAPPKYVLPSSSIPLTDKCLKNAWKDIKSLRFISLDRSNLPNIKANIPNGLNPSEAGLKLLRIANTPLLLPKGMPATGHKVCIKSATPVHTDRLVIERRIMRQQEKEQRRLRNTHLRKSYPCNNKNENIDQDDTKTMNPPIELPPTPPSSISAPETPQTFSSVNNGDSPTPPTEDTSSTELFDSYVADNSSNNTLVAGSNNYTSSSNSNNNKNNDDNNNNNNNSNNFDNNYLDNSNDKNDDNCNIIEDSIPKKNTINIDKLLNNNKEQLESFRHNHHNTHHHHHHHHHHITLPLTLKNVITERQVRPTKRRLSEKDIIVTENGEVKRRRVRRQTSYLNSSTNNSNTSSVVTVANCNASTSSGKFKCASSNPYCQSANVSTTNGFSYAGRTNGNSSCCRATTSTSCNCCPGVNYSSCSCSSNDAVVANDLKSCVYSYFGAASRIAAGEEYTVMGKRTTLDGKVQYLIEWKNSQALRHDC